MAEDRFSASVSVSVLREGVVVVEFVGEHDLTTSDETRELLTRLVGENGLVVVDLSAATFIDSSFLSCLLAAERRAKESGHEFGLLVGDAPNVHAVLEVSGLSDRFTIFPSRAEI